MSKILAVDDESDILFTLKAIAEVANFNIETTDRGLKALDYLKENNYDLLMVDYHMPDINGLQLVRQARKINAEIPILVLTVDESMDLAEKFLEAGADDFANKPIKTADLISRIKLHLNYNEQFYPTVERVQDLNLPGGMSDKTLKIIYQYLTEINKPHTIQEISAGTGLAYQTVHRYLNFLEESRIVKLEMDYGKVGRPLHKYILKILS